MSQDKIHPDYVKAFDLIDDSIPTIETMEQVVKNQENHYKNFEQYHHFIYSEIPPILRSWEEEKYFESKTPKYEKDYRISYAELKYLRRMCGEAKCLLLLVKGLNRAPLSDKIKTVEGMVPMPTPLESFLQILKGATNYGDPESTYPFSGIEVKSLAEQISNFIAIASQEEKNALNELFETPIKEENV